MLNTSITNYIVFLPLFLNFVFFFIFFFSLNFYNVKITKNITDISDSLTQNFSYKINNYKIIFFFLNILILNFFFFYFFCFYEMKFWWNHFSLTNLNLNIIIIFYIFIAFFFFLFKNNQIYLNNFKNDYFLSLCLIFIFSIYVYMSNNFFSFIFLIEITSLTIFYNFSCSKIWNSKFNSTNKLISNFSLKKHVNLLFFQFWASFFSTVIFVYIFIFLIMKFNTTEWLLVNYLSVNSENYNNLILYFLFFSFTLAFFLKLGITPFQLYKIEIYKGLPFLSIYFYASIFYFFYFIVYLYMVVFNFYFFSNYVFFSLNIILIFSFLISLVQIFDLNYSKAFFAYSTIINSFIFIFFLLASI